jgi:fructose-1,6-bisphosphatase/inositol monophosphatase family enzyme
MSDDISLTVTECRAWLLSIVDIARRAGEMVREALSTKRVFNCKQTSQADLVTETDQLVERMIFESLKKQFPQHR